MTESFSGSLADCPAGSSMALRHAVTCALPFSAKIRPEQAQLNFTQLAYNPYYWSNIDAQPAPGGTYRGMFRTLSYCWTYEEGLEELRKMQNVVRSMKYDIVASDRLPLTKPSWP